MNKIIPFICTPVLLGAFLLLSCQKKDTTKPADPVTSKYGDGNGKITLYTFDNIPNGVTWTIGNKTVYDNVYWSGTPDCDASNAASFILPAGNYSFYGQQKNGSATWNGNVTIVSGQCVPQKYSYNGGSGTTTGGTTTGGTTGGSTTGGTTGSTTGGSTTGGTTGGSGTKYALFYTTNSSYNSIDIYINNVFKGTISCYYTSGTPDCNNYNCAVRVAVSGTNNTWYAKEQGTNTTWTGNVTLNNTCNLIKLN